MAAAVDRRFSDSSQSSVVPTTSWAAPANIFDGGTLDITGSSFNNSTATWTAPSSGLADGYFITVHIEFRDTSNGRCNILGRVQQTAGTGNFITGVGQGYLRDSSEDNAYIRCWAFVDSPSAASTFQYQWIRGSDAPNSTDGPRRCVFEVVEFFYSNIGIYKSTSTSAYGGTTLNTVTGFSANYESDTSAIEIASDVVTLKGAGKRYFMLGSSSFDSGGSTRTQRCAGFEVDDGGGAVMYQQQYSYGRSTSNPYMSMCWADIIERDASNIDVNMYAFRGFGVGLWEGGADSDGSSLGNDHAMVFIELHDATEVFRTRDTVADQNVNQTGPIDINIARTAGLDLMDSGSFARESDTAINAEVELEGLFGANVFCASGDLATGSRWTCEAFITEDGVEAHTTKHGNYMRNAESTADCFGWSAFPCGTRTLSLNSNVGVSLEELSGTERAGGNDVETQDYTNDHGVTFWGINLSTMETPSGGGEQAGSLLSVGVGY